MSLEEIPHTMSTQGLCWKVDNISSNFYLFTLWLIILSLFVTYLLCADVSPLGSRVAPALQPSARREFMFAPYLKIIKIY